MINDRTTHLDLPLPHIDNELAQDVDRLRAAMATIDADVFGKLDASLVGSASGIAPLGSDSKIPSAYLPSYVDDVLEFADFAAFPGTGEAGKIYVPLDTNKTWRWSGSAYVEISASPGSSDAVTEGVTNLYYTTARAATKQDALASGANIKTVNGSTLLGIGDLVVSADPSTVTHTATSKATPVDADEIPLADSEATFGLKKLTWANLKADIAASTPAPVAPTGSTLYLYSLYGAL